MSLLLSSFCVYFIQILTFTHSSRTCLTRFQYDVTKKKYGDNIQLLFRETDALISEVWTDDFYQVMWPMKE